MDRRLATKCEAMLYLLLTAGVFILFAAPASADTLLTAASVSVSDSTVCSVGFVTTSPSSCTRTFPGITETGRSVGNLAAGTMGAYSQITADSTAVSSFIGGANGTAAFEYVFNNLGVSTGTLRFALTADGTETLDCTQCLVSANVSIEYPGLAQEDSFAAGTFNESNGTVTLESGKTNFVVVAPIVNGSATLALVLSASSDCTGPNCTATSDFVDTVAITAAREFDPSGNLVADSGFVSEGGFDPNAVLAPEPSTLLLLLAGLVGLVGIGYFQKRSCAPRSE